MNIRESWKRIADWHRQNVSKDHFRLAKGVGKRRFDAFEKALGLLMPEDVRESYSLHNGSTWLLNHGEVMSLEAIEVQWLQLNEWQQEDGYGIGWTPTETVGPIKLIWWNPLRIPITDNGGGDPVTIDLDPGKGGHRGQVIKFNHEVGPVRVLAQGWSAWLQELADGLERGEYAYVESENMVAPVGWYKDASKRKGRK